MCVLVFRIEPGHYSMKHVQMKIKKTRNLIFCFHYYWLYLNFINTYKPFLSSQVMDFRWKKSINILEIHCVSTSDKTTNFTSWAWLCQKMDLGFKIQKINYRIRIRILDIPWVPIFRQNREIWPFLLKVAEKLVFDLIFRKKNAEIRISILKISFVPIIR